MATKFYTLALNICGSSVCRLLRGILLTRSTSRLLLRKYFFNFLSYNPKERLRSSKLHLFFYGATAPLPPSVGQGLLIHEVSRTHTIIHSHTG